MDEVESFREEFYSKRKIHYETNKNNNREKEKKVELDPSLSNLKQLGLIFTKDLTYVKEAIGLDAGPRIVQKLVGLGDNRTSNIVKRIAEEEIAHVAVGVSWFLTVCRKMGCMPDKTFTELLEELDVELKGTFNYEARAEAGMPRDWYDTSNLGLSRWDNHLDVENDKERMILQDVSTEQAHCNPRKFPVSDEGIKTADFDLSKVYERLRFMKGLLA